MPLIVCDLAGIPLNTKCNDRGGIRTIYWTEFSNINRAALFSDAQYFDPVTETILDYPPLLNSGVFNKVEFEKKRAFYNFNYTRENDYYELLVTLGFRGKDIARRYALQRAITCCNIWLHIYSNDGTQRVVGVDWNGEASDSLVEYLSIVRHDDTGGQLGSSRAGDELDLGGQALYAPLFGTVDEADIPLS